MLDRLSLLDETLRAFDAALPSVVRSRCVVTRYRASTCRDCVDACPVAAIDVDPLRVDADLCIACGACAAVCRTGALDYPQPRALIHERICGHGGGEVVVACSQATTAVAEVAPQIVIACLGSLSAPDLIAAAAAGRERLVLVSGGCEDCPASGLRGGMDLGAAPAAAWLGAIGVPLQVEWIRTPSNGASIRPPAATVSRRDLFGLLMGRGRVVAAAALASSSPRIEDIHAVTPPPGVHRRMLDDLAALASRADAASVRLPDDLPLAAVAATQDCDSCGLCTRYCPHGALAIVEGALAAEWRSCTGCGLCVDMCPRGALVADALPLATAGRASATPART
jgi:Fe-S-cluster-containing hydrogenase component 2